MRSTLATSHHSKALRTFNSTLTPKSRIYRGNSVTGPHTITSAPSFCKAKMLDSATRECKISPIMATFLPPTSPKRSRIEKASSRACVGCSWVPSPAFTIFALMCLARKCGAPALAWRITSISTFIARILLTVSSRVSPFFTELPLAEKLITSADKRFWASSKDSRVRVEFSKNTLAMVMSRSEGTFFIGRFRTSLKWAAVSKINWISAGLSSLMPKRCLTLSSCMDYFSSVLVTSQMLSSGVYSFCHSTSTRCEASEFT